MLKNCDNVTEKGIATLESNKSLKSMILPEKDFKLIKVGHCRVMITSHDINIYLGTRKRAERSKNQHADLQTYFDQLCRKTTKPVGRR